MNGIGKTGLNQNRDSISIWNVYLPFNTDREQYIKTCFLTGTVILINDNGEQQRAKIGKLAIQTIVFPIDQNSVGSQVICLTAPYSGFLYVADVYTTSSEFHDQDENQYRLMKSNDSGFAELRIDGNGSLLLTVNSEQSSGGEIKINVTNKDRNGKLNINVNGELNIVNDGKILIQTTKEVLVDSPKIQLNESDEPILLGNKTTDLLQEILDTLNKESAGPYPLRSQAIYAQIKEKLDSLKSTKSFVE